ncbi:MAG: GGDEF domain-containing protein [Deltaproteobacteria bacterium]|nr:MAG: GGDEF domain-containing protein [Deltaproteobacteria bacterium]
MLGSPPIVAFTLRVLDAADAGDVLEQACTGFVELCGARAAAAFAGDRSRLAAVGTPKAEDVRLSFAMARPGSEPVTLDVWVEPSPDLPIVRQQILDLVAVVRRAYQHAVRLDATRKVAEQDPLTGLGNRRGLEGWVDALVQRARCEGGNISLMVVDLDRFKAVNDRFGHAVGDEVLKAAADCMLAHVRPSDRVVRWGGDEFVVVLDGASAQQAVTIAERLRHAFAKDPRSRGTTMTVGIADLDAIADRPAGAAALFEAADASLYAAKEAGRNCCCIAAPTAQVA